MSSISEVQDPISRAADSTESANPPREHLLFHYTRSAENVASILQNGFMMVPNRRNLIRRLLPDDGFVTREPQQFGMVSFTELRRDGATSHRERFGEFAIGVSWTWAAQHRAQRVLYLGDGPVLHAFAWLFQYSRQELAANFTESPIEAVLVNRAAASIYSQAFSHLLTLYEFMEPDSNSSQIEWRIVNPLPQYHRLEDWVALMSTLLSQARRGLGTLRLEPSDVEVLVCPKREMETLRSLLPSDFKETPILAFESSDTKQWRRARFRRRIQKTLEAWHRRLAPIDPSPTGGPTIAPSPILHDVYRLPALAKLGGIQISPDRVVDRARCNIQYEDMNQNILELEMPIGPALELYAYLQRALADPALRPILNALAARSPRQS